MKLTLKLEELGMFLFGIFLFSQLNCSWWWFWGFLLAPDISMVGYLFNNKIGALLYNIFHHRGLAVLVYLIGIYLMNESFQLAGIILFAHSSMDRMFGYGLKYEQGFKFTHLGEIGNKSKSNI